jgi:hypothetical protein
LYGEWVDIIVDDLLPYFEDNTLAFCSNKTENNEFWGALLGKIYKLFLN